MAGLTEAGGGVAAGYRLAVAHRPRDGVEAFGEGFEVLAVPARELDTVLHLQPGALQGRAGGEDAREAALEDQPLEPADVVVVRVGEQQGVDFERGAG